MNKSLILLLALFTISFSSTAQRGAGQMPKIGVVIGKVLDAQSNKPVEYASVSILSTRDSSLVGGGVTEANGYFKITELPMGKHYAIINFIGYENLNTQPFVIDRSNMEVGLGNLSLAPAVETLQEVEIIEERPMMEVKLDKKVFDASQIASAQGGSATDILESIPSVEIDMNGNLSLRGNDNVRILIDGKPSALAGSDPATVLRQIPADAIKDIEVITNPSARYDPDGMTGIINIVLKKNKWVGINGSANAGIGNFNRHNAGLNLSYRDSKVNVFSNFNYRNFTFPFNIEQERLATIGGYDSLVQSTNSQRGFNNLSGKLGFDYYLNPYNTITVSGLLNKGSRESSETQETFTASDSDQDFYTREMEGEGNNSGFDLNFNHTKTFLEKGRELISDIRISKGESLENEWFLQDYNSRDSLVRERSYSDGFDQNLIGQIDYIHPIGEDRMFETGLKYIDTKQDFLYLYEREDQDNPGSYDKIESISSDYEYTEQNYSAYAIYSAPLREFEYQIGLRAEQTYFNLNVVDQKEVNRDYFSLFPSAFLSRKLGEKGQMQLSYSRRINRPRARQLSPAVDYGDPLNLRQGNPDLMPEYIDAYEAGYTHSLGKNSISASLYYRKENNVIGRFRNYDPNTGVAILTYENLESSQAIGLELVGSFRTDKWTFMPSLNGFNNSITAGDADLGVDASNYALNAKILLGYNITKTLSVQASSRYRSARITTQGSFKPGVGLDLSARYSFMDRNANLSLSVQNVFNSMRFEAETEMPGYYQLTRFERPGPVYYLTFSYTFGKQDFSFRKKRRGGNWDGGSDDGDMDMM